MDLAESAQAETLDLKSLEPAFSADPFPVYERLRTSSPVARAEGRLPTGASWTRRRRTTPCSPAAVDTWRTHPAG